MDLSTCDREPIHVPGAIQPFGALLAVDDQLRLRRYSANAPALLEALPSIGEPLGAPYADAFAGWLSGPADAGAGLEPIEMRLADHMFDVVSHRSDRWLVVEFEPRGADVPALSAFALRAQRALERVQRQRTIESLLEAATEELWTLTGFDRVMAYRFRHDDSGHVVAERKRENLESFVGAAVPPPRTSPCRHAACSCSTACASFQTSRTTRWPSSRRAMRARPILSISATACCAASRRCMSSTCRTWA